MKATRQTIQLTKGLSPVENPPFNGTWLSEAKNLRMGSGGLELLPTITDPLGLTVSWPFPQIVNLRQEVVVVQSDGLYTADGAWSLSQILSVEIASSILPQFVDLGAYWWVVINGEVYVRSVDDGTISATSSLVFPQVTSLVEYHGQFVGGGVQSSWYDCNSHYAVWGNIGANTFEPDWKNEAGYRDMEIGEIHLVLSMPGQGVMFYGSEGVAMLFPSGNTWGYRKVSTQPIFGPHAAGGSTQQVYINSEGELVSLGGEEGLQKMGFDHLLGSLDSGLVRIMRDPTRNDMYITDGGTCYLLANGQLTESQIIPTWLDAIEGELVGASEGTSTTIQLQLQKHDLTLVGMKTMEFLEIGVQTDGVVEGSMDFAYALGETPYSLGWRPVNYSGFVYMGAAGNVFQPKLRITNPTSLTLPYLTFGVKVVDNRIQNQLQTMSDRSWNVN